METLHVNDRLCRPGPFLLQVLPGGPEWADPHSRRAQPVGRRRGPRLPQLQPPARRRLRQVQPQLRRLSGRRHRDGRTHAGTLPSGSPSGARSLTLFLSVPHQSLSLTCSFILSFCPSSISLSHLLFHSLSLSLSLSLSVSVSVSVCVGRCPSSIIIISIIYLSARLPSSTAIILSPVHLLSSLSSTIMGGPCLHVWCIEEGRPDPGDRQLEEHLHGLQQAAAGCQVPVRGPCRRQRQEPAVSRCKVLPSAWVYCRYPRHCTYPRHCAHTYAVHTLYNVKIYSTLYSVHTQYTVHAHKLYIHMYNVHTLCIDLKKYIYTLQRIYFTSQHLQFNIMFSVKVGAGWFPTGRLSVCECVRTFVRRFG